MEDAVAAQISTRARVTVQLSVCLCVTFARVFLHGVAVG